MVLSCLTTVISTIAFFAGKKTHLFIIIIIIIVLSCYESAEMAGYNSNSFTT